VPDHRPHNYYLAARCRLLSLGSSETSVHFYHTTGRHAPKDSITQPGEYIQFKIGAQGCFKTNAICSADWGPTVREAPKRLVIFQILCQTCCVWTVWTCAKNLAPTGIQSPDRPARSQSLYRLSYPGPSNSNLVKVIT
jgi:hypothetical protein